MGARRRRRKDGDGKGRRWKRGIVEARKMKKSGDGFYWPIPETFRRPGAGGTACRLDYGELTLTVMELQRRRSPPLVISFYENLS